MAVGKKRKKEPDKGGEWKESVVKCCLGKHLKDKRAFSPIKNFVDNSSKIFHTGTLLVNHFVCDMIEKPNVDVGKLHKMLNDQMFFYRAFAIVARSKNKGKKYRELLDFFNKKQDMYPEKGLINRLEDDGPILNAAARQIATNTATYLRTTFASRLKKVVFAKIPEGACPGIANSICWHVRGMPRYARSVLNEEHLAIVSELRAMIAGADVKPEAELNDKWLDKNKGRVVCFLAWILKNFEELKLKNPKGMKRRFNLLPIADQKSHFIAISTVVMRRLMLNSGILGDEIDQETFNESIDEHRSAVFITSRVIRGIKLAGPQTPPCNGTKKFGNTIETNGVSVCFHVLTWRDKMPGMDEPPKKIRKKKRGATAASEEPSVIYDPTKVVGVDPGRCNISSTVQQQSDGSWKKCRLTRKQFYRDSHAESNLKKLQMSDRNNIAGEMAMLSECISKTASVKEFEKYLETKKRVDAKLWKHRLRRCFGLMAMDNYIHKRKTMDKFWKQTVGLKEDTVVAYGDAGFASSGRGERSVPTKTMRKAATRFSRLVVEVDEFNTSKTCCDCGACLLPIRIPGNSKPLRAVRRCGSIECNETPLKSRDWSAAINIFWRLVDQKKVPWLERRP
jgi:hypothetical protein